MRSWLNWVLYSSSDVMYRPYLYSIYCQHIANPAVSLKSLVGLLWLFSPCVLKYAVSYSLYNKLIGLGVGRRYNWRSLWHVHNISTFLFLFICRGSPIQSSDKRSRSSEGRQFTHKSGTGHNLRERAVSLEIGVWPRCSSLTDWKLQ